MLLDQWFFCPDLGDSVYWTRAMVLKVEYLYSESFFLI